MQEFTAVSIIAGNLWAMGAQMFRFRLEDAA